MAILLFISLLLYEPPSKAEDMPSVSPGKRAFSPQTVQIRTPIPTVFVRRGQVVLCHIFCNTGVSQWDLEKEHLSIQHINFT